MRETFRYSIFAGLLTLALFFAPFDFISNAQNVDQEINEIASALDDNQNRVLDDSEILNAIQMWILGEALPDGETISDESILSLVQLWITGASIRPPLMGDDFGDDAPLACTEDTGTLVAKWGSLGSGTGELNSPHGVALDSSGNVYVVDTGNHRIVKYGANGENPVYAGSFGAGNDQLDSPTGIALDSDGNIYVSDSGNHRIVKYDSEAENPLYIGELGTGDDQFNSPQGLAVDSDGNLYVADTFNNRILKFDVNGDFLAKWESADGESDRLNGPNGLALDSDGHIYVADTFNDRIVKFNSNGTFREKWGQGYDEDGDKCEGRGDRRRECEDDDQPDFNNPTSIAIDSLHGMMYVVDSFRDSVQKFDLDDFEDFSTDWGYSGSGDGEFDAPFGMALDSMGYIYVVDTGNHRIQKFCG